jgi:membrane-bound lytic murein transglycosylase D
MSIPWTLVASAVALNLLTSIQTTALPLGALEEPLNRLSLDNEGVMKERIARIALPFEATYNAKVRTYIKDYVVVGYKQTQDILGRSIMYFPIFEHYLTINRLPKELMYLPIVESALNPTAKSGAGAAGLWQLMPQTARQYGLKVDGAVDERLDPYKSTEAAVHILANLYKEYNDWRMVLAAYNCGPTKLEMAMRTAGSKDYWDYEVYLPAQTRRYVPAYIAAAYIANYHYHHKLTPTYPSLNLRETRVLKVYQALTFREIASACGLAPAVITTLNPGYLQKAMPANRKGQFLILPASAVTAFKDYLAGKSAKKVSLNVPNKFKSSYVVAKGDRIENLASLFQCSVDDIVRWNGLSDAEVFVNQELIVYLPKDLLQKRA